MTSHKIQELNIIKSYSDIIFSADWRLNPTEMPIEIFIEYLRKICMNNLHKEAHQYLEEKRIYEVGWDEFDEEEDEEGQSTVRINNLLLRQLENLKNNGIKNVKITDEVNWDLFGDEIENFNFLFVTYVNFI